VDPLTLALWAIRLAFLAALYLFLALVVRTLLRDIRAASRDPAGALGRLVVISSAGLPAAGSIFPLDAVTTLGRDLGSSVVLDDAFASARHAILTFRGRGWYVEDLGSTNGTLVNGVPVTSALSLGFGDELQIGEIRMRLERGIG
jgi:pSer/pThr/pTyr-binding forkhead associated (FHA) protein